MGVGGRGGGGGGGGVCGCMCMSHISYSASLQLLRQSELRMDALQVSDCVHVML